MTFFDAWRLLQLTSVSNITFDKVSGRPYTTLLRNEAEILYAEQKYNPCCIRPNDQTRPSEQEASEVTQLQSHAPEQVYQVEIRGGLVVY